MNAPDHKGQSLLDRATLAKIHIAVKQLCIEEDDYRAILERTTGKRSARDLGPEHLSALQREFRRLGWGGYLLRRDDVPPLKYAELGTRPGRPNPRQLRKFDALFNTTPGYGTIDPEKALRAFLKKRFRVDDIKFLNLRQFEVALKAIREIRRRKGLTDDDR